MDVAERKAMAARERISFTERSLVLSADTMVVLGDESLAKPDDEAHAFAMLSKLSGQTHEVYTAICLLDLNPDKSINGSFLGIDRSEVEFFKLSDQQINEYIQTGEPMDKAGSYGLQGLGGRFVKEIRGERDNVIGLPRKLLENVLKEKGWWNELRRNS